MGYALVKQLLILVYFVYVGLNGGKGVDYAAHFILTVDLIYLFLPVFVPYPPLFFSSFSNGSVMRAVIEREMKRLTVSTIMNRQTISAHCSPVSCFAGKTHTAIYSIAAAPTSAE